MTELNTEELIYLLYADAYSEAGTVTKSTVKSYLPNEWKGKAEKIYDALQSQELIKPTSKGRFSVTEQGGTVLVTNLATTAYKFDSIKGPKVLNTLLNCIRKAAEAYPQVTFSKDMTFDEFQDKFKTLYFEERKQQALQGVVVIRKREISKHFMDQNSILQHQFEKYFEMLKTKGEISMTEGREDELIEWVE
ncbi:hypothetical protein SD80_016765 [Scytonema tolypothrichoides VB-61278]|nr:hypothetical protein SD80_016765 [Scytonema tolypothrichoides VB-61278]